MLAKEAKQPFKAGDPKHIFLKEKDQDKWDQCKLIFPAIGKGQNRQNL